MTISRMVWAAALPLLALLGACSDEPAVADSASPITTTTAIVSEATPPPQASSTTVAPDVTTTTATPTTLSAAPVDNDPPPLTVTAPADGAVVTSPNVRFEGTTEPGATVAAWDRWFADVDTDGRWSLVLVLDPGTNIARFTATDAAGNIAAAETVVRYDPPEPVVSRTVVETFTPSIVPDDHQDGFCGGPSNFTPRTGAYRCMTGSEIHDPCFSTGEDVVCGADPILGTTGFILDLTEPLPTEPAPTGATPWILTMSDGTACWAAGGATNAIDGVRIHYGCADGSWVLQDLRAGEPWTGHRIVLDDSLSAVATDYGFVAIAHIWQ